MPHQCAHWFAMTRGFYAAVSFLHCASPGASVGNMLACSAFSLCIAVDCGTGEPVPYDALFVHRACRGCHRGDGLPHQCAHWFAKTHLFTLPCHFYVVRVVVPRGCGLPHQCAHWLAMTHLFTLPCHIYMMRVGVPQGRRIATPVCALVRNDTLFLRSRVIFA